MKKKGFIFLIIIIILLTAPSYFLFFSSISEKRYNKIMSYVITRSLTDKSENFYDKVVAIRDFVHENVLSIHGYHNRLATCAIEKLIYGIGWCDQQARVFMQLARSIGITSRLLFLQSASGASPHSIAEVLAPDKKWIIVDPAYKLDLVNKNGNFATQSDIKEDLSIIADNKRVKLRAEYEKRWADPSYLAVYCNLPTYVITKEGVRFDFLRFIPLRLIRPIVYIINERYLNKIKPEMKDIYEFKMTKARTYHLLGYYKKSEKLYKDVIMNSRSLSVIRRVEYYRAILLKDQKRYEDAYLYITGIISKDKDNPYMPYLRGQRAQILEKMGKTKEAEEDLMSVEYDLQV
ncbi:MAG: transglutaminase domain-containing protein [Candidatus Omnitrophica bacterium]|nr:transglutaminase domain-containing protein [Candidatus Omnitrophota bacterium]